MVKKKLISGKIFILFSVFFSLYIFEFLLISINYPNLHSMQIQAYPEECEKKNKEIKSEKIPIDHFYEDGGFRNLEYAKNKEGFLTALLDTLCLNDQTYRDHDKTIKFKLFKNDTYIFNSLGFRGDEWHNKNKNIFLLGGSTAFSLLSSENDSIHKKIQNYINIYTKGNNYSVFNASKPGMLSFDEYRTLTRYVDDYKSDIIVFLTGYNNASNNIKDIYDDKHYKYKKYANYIINKTLSSMYLDNIAALVDIVLDSPIKTESNSIDSFIKYTNLSNDYCIKKQKKCIFVLQPSLQTIKKPLTSSEQKVKDSHFNTFKPEISTNFENSYEVFRNQLSGNKFNFLDLSNINNHDGFTGYLDRNHSFSVENFQKIEVQEKKNYRYLENDVNNYLKIFVQNKHNIKSFSFCDKSKITIYQNSKINNECHIKNYDSFRKVLDNKTLYKKPIIYLDDNLTDYIFKLKNLHHLEKIIFNIYALNEQDYENIVINASISKNGKDYIKLKKIKKDYLNGNFTFDWSLDNYSGDIYIKINLTNSSLIGIKEVKLNLYSLFNNDDHSEEALKPMTIKNIGKEEIYVISYTNGDYKEIFIDAAHLTDFGNDIIAENISRYIVENY